MGKIVAGVLLRCGVIGLTVVSVYAMIKVGEVATRLAPRIGAAFRERAGYKVNRVIAFFNGEYIAN